MLCAKCGTENEQGRKFCGECGKPLAVACPSWEVFDRLKATPRLERLERTGVGAARVS